MGRMKEYMMDLQEESRDQRLARLLEITVDELVELDYSIDNDVGSDGMIFNYIISFREDAPRNLLSKIKGIDNENTVWLDPRMLDGWDFYYKEQYNNILSNRHFYKNFLSSVSSLRMLNEVDIDEGHLTIILKRQIYISVIASLEAFLSETFISLTNKDSSYFRNFIETYPDFKERKIELSRIFVEQERLNDTAQKVMVEVLYHNLGKVRLMYQTTFRIEFPDITKLSKCIAIRHDLVHRNGKSTSGENIEINSKIIFDLIDNVSEFVDDIAKKLVLSNK
jgi:hypothetical protein